MSHKNDRRLFAVCGKIFPLRDLVPDKAVRDVVTTRIARDNSDWSAMSYICRPGLMKFRERSYFVPLFRSDTGRLEASAPLASASRQSPAS